MSSTFIYHFYALNVDKSSGKNTEDCNIEELSVMVPPEKRNPPQASIKSPNLQFQERLKGCPNSFCHHMNQKK